MCAFLRPSSAARTTRHDPARPFRPAQTTLAPAIFSLVFPRSFQMRDRPGPRPELDRVACPFCVRSPVAGLDIQLCAHGHERPAVMPALEPENFACLVQLSVPLHEAFVDLVPRIDADDA